MAVPGERATIDGDGEPRIPVFTVVKNGAVLKNIFVVDKPPPPSPPPPPPPGGPARPRQADGAKTAAGGREGRGEMLIVGRHPDCHIMLTHPSISRFHLQIHSDPSRRKLSVVDLSSVHGTWVSEKKIEPGVVVELSEGDTLRVGGSSRVYRLHWVPLSRAYDFENPFVSALDASGADEEKEEEDLVIDEGKVEEEREDEDSLEIGCEDDDDLESSFVLEDEEHVHQDSFQDENKGIHSPESLLKGVEALALDDCEELPAKNQSPSQLPIPENPYASTYGEKETDAGLGSKAVDDFFMLAEYLQTEPMDASSPFRILFDVDNQKFNEEKWSTEVGIATKLVSANKGSIRSAHDDLENCLVAEAFEDNRKFNEEKWSTEVGIATELVSANEGSIRSAHDDLENCVVAEAFVDNRKFNEEKWSTEVGIATELVSADEGSIRSADDDLENCSVAEAFGDSQKFNEERWSMEVGIATELVSADEGSIRSAHDDLENCLVAEDFEDNWKFNEEKWSMEVGIAAELVSADEGSIKSAHDDLENCSVAEAFEGNQKFNEEKWSMEVGIATELVSADEGSIRSAHDDPENCLVAETFEESKCTLSIDSEVGDSLSHPSAPYYPRSSCPEIFSEMENQQLGQEDNAEQPFNTLGSLSSGGKTRTLRKERKPFTSMLIDDARPRKGCSSAFEVHEESQNQVTHIDNQEDGDTLSHHFAKSLVDTITSSESDREILLETTDQHLNDENQRPQYGSVTGRLSESGKESSPLGQSCTKSKCSSIWSRRGKPSTILQLQTNRRKGMTKSAATASRNKQHNQDNNENQLSAVPFLSLDGEEEEMFTPDKENLTPNTRLLKSLKKISKMEVAEARPVESFRRSSSKLSPMANFCNEEDVFYSDKENQTPEGLREQKMARRASGSSSRLRRELGLKQGAERSAFKSLNVRSSSQSTASGGAMKSGLSVDGVRALGRKVSALSANKSYGEPNKSWIMVVDTTSFLNKESMKSLQLLQGLKGTQLFIPRIVIRELDCLKRRASVFRRTTEVSSALEWIEDTMVNLKWWIHVQRSMEEGMSVAPTPPATPRCIFVDVSETFSAATPGGSVMDIISPTTEDHVLESALFYRKTNPNGQLVLLSNDISLKIKAMAEGILCETAQEFRESLVNPFSDRFLWADSSPRGQTWSCLDDVVLKEKYYSRPSKKSARGEGLSGLKLILLHNSQYGQQIRSVG